MKLLNTSKTFFSSLIVAAALCATAVSAQTLTSNQTGTHNGFYYSFWKDSGNASFGLHAGGRYTSQWNSGTNNWVGGKGWNPGGPKIVNYSGSYNVTSSQNSYLALYGWTKNPLIEYYIIESYGSYNPASCSGGTDYGSFQSDGATYNVRRCQRVNQPSIEGTRTFYQYFSVRNPKKGFGNISGTITVANHFNFWASKGLNLGSHDYMVLATEGYQSTGSSDITVSEGQAGGSSSSPSTGSKTIVVRARGVSGQESITLKVNNTAVATWTLSTNMTNYTATTNLSGGSVVEYTNDATGRDVQVDYISVNGAVRQSEAQSYNTGVYQNGACGGGNGMSEWLHCNGAIGYGNL
jgi:endo-1,4-beta-xylanase